MKKTFLKSGLFLALALTTAVFYSCEKDDDNSGNGSDGNASTINATNVVNGSSKITTVKAEIYWETGDWDDDDSEYGYYTIAEAQYKNNSFKMELPSTVPAKYLQPIMEDDDMEGVTVSDKTVKGAALVDFAAYDKDGEELGWLVLVSADPSDDDENGSVATWIYVDKNITVNGQEVYDDYNEVYIEKYNNITLKKWWNIVYMSTTETYNQSTKKTTYTETYSTQKPSGVTLKWYFCSYDGDYGVLKPATSLSGKNSFFSQLKQERR